jgi:uncharacterized protein YybS (DUF2232 family)
MSNPHSNRQDSAPLTSPEYGVVSPLAMVETAFLASTTALIWLINYYFPLGPVLRVFFSLPIALAYLRWGRRSAWMTTLVACLLLAVLMGPPRSLQFLMPYGLLGVTLGGLWRRRVGWPVSLGWGTLVAATGLFFQIGLVSLLLGENLWLYLNRQVTSLLEWLFTRLGLFVQADIAVVQVASAVLIVFNSAIYLLAVHLIAWLLLERLGNPIPMPPRWIQVILDYEEN